jgi:hypothetical protein
VRVLRAHHAHPPAHASGAASVSPLCVSAPRPAAALRPVEASEPWTVAPSAGAPRLMSKQEVLGGDNGTRGEKSPDGDDQETDKVDHPGHRPAGGAMCPPPPWDRVSAANT